MAKVVGAQHSDFVKGTISGQTFRAYRGTQIVSTSRRMVKARPKREGFLGPLAIPILWSRWSADKRVTLRATTLQFFVERWGDQKFGAGDVFQTSPAFQPQWIAGDPARRGRPYIIADGLNDTLSSVLVPDPITQPLEVWMVGSEPDLGVDEKQMIGFRDLTTSGVSHLALPSPNYLMKMSSVPKCGETGDGKVKIWRWKFQGATSKMEWNGVAQTPNINIGSGTIDRLFFFSNRNTNRYSRFKCFEIDIFRGILSDIQRSQLLEWFKETYNLPA